MGVYIKGVTKAEMLTIITQQGESIRTADIIEVAEPHGDLIDRERIDYKNYKMHDGRGKIVLPDTFVDGVLWISERIYETPTVIEAEGE